ncbi:hypothetical protein AAC387_Pa03g3299 [Persea americana]
MIADTTTTTTRSNSSSLPRMRLSNLLSSSTNRSSNVDDHDHPSRISNASDINHSSAASTPYMMSPYNANSPFARSPWFHSSMVIPYSTTTDENFHSNGLIGSLVREEGHIYSLAASENLLYTGSDSKNIRVWKNQKEFAAFKSASGLVKAIVISGQRIYTGHQDGKIRIWKVSSSNPTVHKRVGTLPRLKDYIKSSINRNNYVEVRRNRSSVWIKHFDAVSCLSLDEDQGLLYSGSWDKTLKVWRISDSKCLESIAAHDDAINSVVNGLDGLIFTGSADGTVKMWRRELQGKRARHVHLQTLLKQESAVTALAVNQTASVIYSGSSDGLINFWEKGKHLSHGGVLRGHKLAVLCLAAAGSLVLSGSADKSICVWKREGGTHTCLSQLNGHMGPVKCLAMEADQEHHEDGCDRRWIVYSGSLDKSVKMWMVSEQRN